MMIRKNLLLKISMIFHVRMCKQTKGTDKIFYSVWLKMKKEPNQNNFYSCEEKEKKNPTTFVPVMSLQL